MIGLTHIADGLLDLGKGVLSLADGCLNLANSVLDFVKKATAIGLKILADMAKKLFRLNKLEVYGKLDSSFNACVGLYVDCVILGAAIKFDTSACLNMEFLANLVGKTMETKYPGVDKEKKELEAAEGKFADYDKAEAQLNNKIEEAGKIGL